MKAVADRAAVSGVIEHEKNVIVMRLFCRCCYLNESLCVDALACKIV